MIRLYLRKAASTKAASVIRPNQLVRRETSERMNFNVIDKKNN